MKDNKIHVCISMNNNNWLANCYVISIGTIIPFLFLKIPHSVLSDKAIMCIYNATNTHCSITLRKVHVCMVNWVQLGITKIQLLVYQQSPTVFFEKQKDIPSFDYHISWYTPDKACLGWNGPSHYPAESHSQSCTPYSSDESLHQLSNFITILGNLITICYCKFCLRYTIWIYISPTIRSVDPAKWKVAIWIWTGQTLHSALCWLSFLGTSRIMSVTRSFELLEMMP